MIRIFPLRKRKEGIPLLVNYFVQKSARQMQKRIDAVSTAVRKGLTAWDWPGNVRELENLIERAVILTHGRSLAAQLAELRRPLRVESTHAALPAMQESMRAIPDSRKSREAVVEEYAKHQHGDIVRALAACKGRVRGSDGAAARLGINRTTFLSRMKKFGVHAKQFA